MVCSRSMTPNDIKVTRARFAVLTEQSMRCAKRSWLILMRLVLLSIKQTNSTNAATAVNFPRSMRFAHVGKRPNVLMWYTALRRP